MLLAIKWLIAEILKRFNNVLYRNCVSHYINLQALRQTTTTASHYVLLWRCLHLKKIKIQGLLTFLFSILIPFKEKKNPTTNQTVYSPLKRPFMFICAGQIHSSFTPVTQEQQRMGWREDMWMDKGKLRSWTITRKATVSQLMGWKREMDSNKTAHCQMAKSGRTSFPSTVLLCLHLRATQNPKLPLILIQCFPSVLVPFPSLPAGKDTTHRLNPATDVWHVSTWLLASTNISKCKLHFAKGRVNILGHLLTFPENQLLPIK